MIIEKYELLRKSRTISENSLVALCFAYVILITLGAIGNGLVCIAVVRKPAMRTERNVFIINLAISDLLLCLFTMPFTLFQIVARYWPLGLLTCKLVEGLEATSIFVSTISMTAIALDRYNVIINATKDAWKPLKSIVTLILVWIFGLTLSLPLFWSRTIKEDNLREMLLVNLPNLETLMNIPNETVELCIEEWPLHHGRAMYSTFTIIIQYIVPIIIVSVSYICICNRLNNRMAQKTKATQLAEKREKDRNRVQRTNLLLRCTAIIFGISWLPLNILNFLTDSLVTFEDESTFRIVFACCHMIGMSSACSNPLLYGWLNDNFRKEFDEILSKCIPCRRTQSTEVVLCEEEKWCSTHNVRNGSAKKSCETVVVTNL